MPHWRLRTSAVQGWTSVPVAKDGEKGPCAQPRFGRETLELSLAIHSRKGFAQCLATFSGGLERGTKAPLMKAFVAKFGDYSRKSIV
ncbi:MAG TPA: hypothetical protein VIM32_02910 [Desulfosporosinus sp.]